MGNRRKRKYLRNEAEINNNNDNNNNDLYLHGQKSKSNSNIKLSIINCLAFLNRMIRFVLTAC